MEPEFARFAAENRTEEQVREFHEILKKEESADYKNIQNITDLDFEFHLLIAVASGNAVFPLLLNSFRQVCTNIVSIKKCHFDRREKSKISQS